MSLWLLDIQSNKSVFFVLPTIFMAKVKDRSIKNRVLRRKLLKIAH